MAILFLMGSAIAVHASVCNISSGNISCGHGTVDNLSGDGMVTVDGTTVSGATLVNGVLHAENAIFFSLGVNINPVHYK